MHYYRVALSGPPADMAAIAAEVGLTTGETHIVVAREEAIEFWESLSRRHRAVAFGIEYFEEFEDELLHVVIRDGETTEMGRESLLPRYRVYFDREDDEPGDEFSADDVELFEMLGDDDEGEPMDEARVRMAAGLISAARLRHPPQTFENGLAAALMIGRMLGRLCRRTEATAYGQPSREAVDAVVEIAVHTLCMTLPSDLDPPERDFKQALTLTRSAVHAASSPYYHETWSDWLRILIGSVGHLLDAATSPLIDREDTELEVHSVAVEHYSTAAEALDLEVRSLLTTCIEALALFGEPDRAPV